MLVALVVFLPLFEREPLPAAPSADAIAVWQTAWQSCLWSLSAFLAVVVWLTLPKHQYGKNYFPFIQFRRLCSLLGNLCGSPNRRNVLRSDSWSQRQCMSMPWAICRKMQVRHGLWRTCRSLPFLCWLWFPPITSCRCSSVGRSRTRLLSVDWLLAPQTRSKRRSS